MASVQQVGGVSQQINDKQKAAIEEAVQKAQRALGNEINDAKARQPQQELVVGGTRNDLHDRGLFLYKSHNYTGYFLVKPSQTIDADAFGTFLHQGSKAYVIYGTSDNPHFLGYLLAWSWSKPANSSDDKAADLIGKGKKITSKVYVEAGELSTLLKQTDDEIERKLDASRESSHSYDPNTGAGADAIISGITNLGLLGARFYQHRLN